MTREEAKERLVNVFGIEEPTKAQVSAYLNDRKNVESEIRESIETEVKAGFKEYLNPKDAQALKDEITSLKDASAKNERIGKYKASKVKEKWLDYVDDKLRNSENIDEDLKNFLKDNSELCEVETPVKTNVSKATFSGLKDSGATVDTPNAKINAFIRGENK